MENKELETVNEKQQLDDTDCEVKIRFSLKEKKECYINFKKKVIKLLYLIEGEQEAHNPIDFWFYGFMYELVSANKLCNNELTQVVIKIHGLYNNSHYKEMTHAQIKRQIMECKGILEHLIDEVNLDLQKHDNISK